MNSDPQAARNLLAAPSIGIQIAALVNILTCAAIIVTVVVATGHDPYYGNSWGYSDYGGGPERFLVIAGSSIVLGSSSFLSLLLFFGAWRMRKLKSYGLSLITSILVCIPVITVCCPLGLPFGIWALYYLFKPEVRESFN